MKCNLNSQKVYKDAGPSFSTIKKWATLFKSGRTSLEDDSRESHPKIATTPEIIQQVYDMVLDDRRVKVKEIADILHQELNMRELCARWVPHLLTIDQKRIRMRISQVCLDRF